MAWWSRPFRGRRGPADADQALRRALYASLEQERDRVGELLAAAARLDPDDLDTHFALGRFYRTRGETGRAIRIHQNLLLRPELDDSQRLEALAELASDFRRGGFLRRAIASYEEVVARDPRHLGALRGLSALARQVRDFDRALEIEKRLARVEGRDFGPAEADLHLEKAGTALAEGRTSEALKATRRALRRAPDRVAGWQLLGTIEAERGKSRAALDAWKKVAELDRQAGPEVYPRLEATFAAAGKPVEFEQWLEGLIEARPDDPWAHLALAHAKAARGETDEAVAAARRAVEADRDTLAAHAAVGQLLAAGGRDADALKSHAELLDTLDRLGLLRRREVLD